MTKLRTEKEIMQAWNPADKPLVSVACITYNHEKYIKDAIDGFLIQETDFPFEILIHDDASTDNTANIVREYAEKYPYIIKSIFQTENQYSKGKRIFQIATHLCAGDYIAICDGDDYWIDRHKLTKQISSMKNNPICNISFHAATQFDLNRGGVKQIIGRYANKNCIVKLEDIILKTHGMIPTASCLIKKEAMDRVIDFQKENPFLTVGDIYIQIIGSLSGGAMYIDEVMSIYRLNVPNSWNEKQSKDYRLQIDHANSRLRSFVELDKLSNYQYTSTFKLANNKFIFHVLRNFDIPRVEKVEFLKKNHQLLSLSKKALGALIIFFTDVPTWMRRVNHRLKILFR